MACIAAAASAGSVDEAIFGYSGYGGQPLPQLTLTVGGSTVTLDATASGWYDNTGFHDSTNSNYLVGFCTAVDCPNSVDTYFNDFFAFDLSSVSGPISGASLSVYEPSEANDNGDGYTSPNASETYQMWDVSARFQS